MGHGKIVLVVPGADNRPLQEQRRARNNAQRPLPSRGNCAESPDIPANPEVIRMLLNAHQQCASPRISRAARTTLHRPKAMRWPGQFFRSNRGLTRCRRRHVTASTKRTEPSAPCSARLANSTRQKRNALQCAVMRGSSLTSAVTAAAGASSSRIAFGSRCSATLSTSSMREAGTI
jgi:hypothetical protein